MDKVFDYLHSQPLFSKLLTTSGVVRVPRFCCDGGYLPVVFRHGRAYIRYSNGEVRVIPAGGLTRCTNGINDFDGPLYYRNRKYPGSSKLVKKVPAKVSALLTQVTVAMKTSGLDHF